VSVEPYDPDRHAARTAWIREHHRAQVTPAYVGTSSWSCTCGAGNSQVTMRDALAQSAKVRHLRAQEAKFDREYSDA
jgi:hypothetical protein